MTTPRPLPPDLAAALAGYRSAVLHLEELVVDPRDRRALQLRTGRDLEGDPSPAAVAERDRRQARGLLHRTAEAVALGLPVALDGEPPTIPPPLPATSEPDPDPATPDEVDRAILAALAEAGRDHPCLPSEVARLAGIWSTGHPERSRPGPFVGTLDPYVVVRRRLALLRERGLVTGDLGSRWRVADLDAAPEPDATPRTGGRKAPRAAASVAPGAAPGSDVGGHGPDPRPLLVAPGAVSGDVAPAGPEGGAARLARWLAGEGRGVRAMARDLGVEPSTVSRWAGGRTVPAPKVRARLEALTGIPASTWEE